MRERNDAIGIPRGFDTPLGVSRSSGTISPYAARMILKDPICDSSRRGFERILNPNLRASDDSFATISARLNNFKKSVVKF